MALTLVQAQKLVTDALAYSREKKFNPMGVIVLDTRGSLVAAGFEDGSSQSRWKIAFGKASGVIAMGVGSRKLEAIAMARPHFANSVMPLFDNGFVPVAGGVLIRDASGQLLGAIGVSGDTSDNDEAAALAAIQLAGLVGDGG